MKALMCRTHRVLSMSSLWSLEHSTAVKHICDVLIASAMVKYSQMDLIQLQMFAVMVSWHIYRGYNLQIWVHICMPFHVLEY